MTRRTIGWLLALALAGCASATSHDPKMPILPPPVEPAPKYSPESLNSGLRARARAELLAETGSPDPFLRCNAIEAMSDVDPADAATIVLNGLTDDQASVRFAAAVAAGQMKLVDAYKPLLAMVDDPDPRVQAGVRFALHRLGDTRLSHDLEHLAASADPQDRHAVAEALLGLAGIPPATAARDAATWDALAWDLAERLADDPDPPVAAKAQMVTAAMTHVNDRGRTATPLTPVTPAWPAAPA